MRRNQKLHLRDTRSRRNTRRSMTKGGRILTAMSAALFILALVFLVRYTMDTVSAQSLQKEMKETYASAQAAQTAPETPIQTAVPQPEALSSDQQPEPVPPSEQPQASAAPEVPQNTAPASGNVIAAELLPLYAKNKDLAGWLTSDAVPDIDFAVVLRDNSFYLDHDFYKRDSLSGCVFLDEQSRILPRSDNLILHGHNMKNGTMFGKLYKYLELDTVLNTPLLRFRTLYEPGAYIPYAVSIVSIDPASPRYVSLLHPAFDELTTLENYANNIRRFSSFYLPVEVAAGDKLLTLVTCHGNEEDERLVVALRQQRPGEDLDAVKALFREKTTKTP